jgi:hypothetical protein
LASYGYSIKIEMYEGWRRPEEKERREERGVERDVFGNTADLKSGDKGKRGRKGEGLGEGQGEERQEGRGVGEGQGEERPGGRGVGKDVLGDIEDLESGDEGAAKSERTENEALLPTAVLLLVILDDSPKPRQNYFLVDGREYVPPAEYEWWS